MPLLPNVSACFQEQGAFAVHNQMRRGGESDWTCPDDRDW
jgi:hypothetical protein